jgi:hypothetical protein
VNRDRVNKIHDNPHTNSKISHLCEARDETDAYVIARKQNRVFREERREARERARTAGLSLMNKRTCPACGAEFDTCRLCGGRGWVCAG